MQSAHPRISWWISPVPSVQVSHTKKCQMCVYGQVFKEDGFSHIRVSWSCIGFGWTLICQIGGSYKAEYDQTYMFRRFLSVATRTTMRDKNPE